MNAKKKFCTLHLGASILIGLLSTYVVFFIWYPLPLAKAIGVTQLFGLLLFIDMILGPLLGWVVYKEGKKTLKFDLAVIILVQILAYGYGIYSVAQGRPLWIVYSQYHFDIVQNKQLDEKDLDKADQAYQQRSFFGPKIVALKGEEQYQNNNFAYQRSGWTSYPPNYTELTSTKSRLIKYALDLKYLNQNNEPERVSKILSKYSEANAWLPLKAPMQDIIVLINKNKGEVVQIVDLKPLR
ncbi:TfpX/TfpZ family type IV pilin accessory protein [Acinetobacter variabilis]|uniref:TfpX/TfpZ family type IV pilin accessory protein n=1 Tax=Acinetobacter variabilis TaxID=70346 RepID=UPI003AF7A980